MKRLLTGALLLSVGIGSYWLTVNSISKRKSLSTVEPPTKVSEQKSATLSSRSLRDPNDTPSTENTDQSDEGALKNQRAIVFKDAESMQKFLSKLDGKVSLLGRIDQLNTLLVSFSDLRDLDTLLNGDEELAKIFPVNIPSFETVGAQPGAIALENGLLKWLGVETDHSQWGKGITIAILDTGIADHIAFKNGIKRINLVPLPGDLSTLNGHGTAVASLIFSDNPVAPGVAPAATPLSIRIADDQGSSNSFLIAQGIIAAVDAGAPIINISLGGSGESKPVEMAMNYARERGAIVVAAAGNTGTEGVMQPAAHPSAIAVGAVDANNQPMSFSTRGNEVAISAPGFGVNVAYPGDSAARVNGTSFSTPIVSGVIAAVATSQNLTIQQASDRVLNHLNDISTEGKDNFTGGGVPNMGTIMNVGISGRYDASINSIYASENNQISLLVQNLGSETLINTAVDVNINGTATQANITTLAPMQTRVINLPYHQSQPLNVQGTVRLTSGQADQRPQNDTFSQIIVPSP